MARPTGRLAAVLLAFSVQSTPVFSQSNTPDIVVTPSRTEEPIQRAGSAVTVITAEEIEQSSVRDVGDLLRRSPGLTVTQNGGPGQIQTVRMRGGESRHTLVLIDGIRVNDPSTTGREFDFSTLVLADVERIEVLRGPQSALYGSDAMGGVINIITRKGGGPPRAHISVEAGSYGTKETKGGISGGDGRVDYAFGFAAFDTAGFSGFGYRIPRLRYLAPWGFEPDSARRTGVTGRIGVNVSDGVRLELGGSYSFNRAQYDAAFLPFPDTPSNATSELGNVYGRLIADLFGGMLRSTVTLFANQTDRRFNDVSYAQGFLFCNNDFFPVSMLTACRTRTQFIGERVGAEYQGDWKLGAAGTFTFGARTERDTADSFGAGIAPNPSPWTRTIAAEQTTDFGLRPAPGHGLRPAAPLARRADRQGARRRDLQHLARDRGLRDPRDREQAQGERRHRRQGAVAVPALQPAIRHRDARARALDRLRRRHRPDAARRPRQAVRHAVPQPLPQPHRFHLRPRAMPAGPVLRLLRQCRPRPHPRARSSPPTSPSCRNSCG